MYDVYRQKLLDNGGLNMNCKNRQYVVITVTDINGEVTTFNFGYIDNKSLKSCESYIGESGISITVYEQDEVEDYNDHVNELVYESDAEMGMELVL